MTFSLKGVPEAAKSLVIASYDGIDGHTYHSKLELQWVKAQQGMVPGSHEIGEGYYYT